MTAPTPSTDDLIVHRPALLRFARRKVRDEALAEDAVQDALVAALTSRDSFQGQSALRTWLFGILNHKIQDAFRRETRYVNVVDSAGDDDSADPLTRVLAGRTSDEDDPARLVAQRRMHEALAAEVDRLPDTLRSVFLMQAVEGIETPEVCRRLAISEANCWVRLHRARKRLTERLGAHLEPA